MASVIIVVFDGLQPAQVTPEIMPNLARFAADGVTCQNHHAVFPTVTRANVASIVTGHHPGAHGLTGNTLVFPEFEPQRAINAMEPILAEIARQHPVLLQPTIGEILHRHGREFVAVGTGTSGNAYLQNSKSETTGGATIHPDFSLPRDLHGELGERFGQWPDRRGPTGDKMAHAGRIFTDHVLAERQPALSLLWLTEPDASQHAHGVGSVQAVAAIREADNQFGTVLDWLDRAGALADINVIVASDHGYSTISEVVDIAAELREAGFHEGDRQGGITVAPNGGSVLFYVTDFPDTGAGAAERLAEWLTSRPWCGPLLASQSAGEIPGTLPARLVGLEGPRAPTLAMSFPWDSTPNAAGFAGHACSTSLAPGQGQHGSMSPHETRNVLFARGPGFKSNATVASPTGNVDIAPTVLHLLGLPGGEAMHGRVLREILGGGTEAVQWQTETHRAERTMQDGIFRQEIQVSEVGDTVYLDHGSSRLQCG